MIGTVLGGKLEVKSRLGAGAMAEVFLAVDQSTGDKVAVKVLAAPQGASGEQLIARFKREFLACARLEHPNVIKLYSFGQVPGGGLYYSMQYLPWPDLEEMLEKQKKASPDFVLHMAEQMASAFSHYHAKAVVHRDLKPANILVFEEENRIIITDFGLARDLDRTKMTETGVMVGSPLYMSPELISGQKADLRSDIFQLGVIAYEALSGKMPFHARDIASLARAICLEDHLPLSELEPSLPAQWADIVDKCLEKEPEHRYQNGDELLDDLQLLRSGKTIKIARRHKEEAFDDDGDYTPIGSSSQRATLSAGKGLPTGGARQRAGRGAGRTAVGASAGTPKSLILLIGAGLSLLLLVFMLLRPQRDINYSMSALHCQTGVQSMTIAWKSETPYVSRVQIQSPETRLVEGSSEKTKDHEVVVSGLQDNTEYTFRILYPSGETSLPQRRKTEKLQFQIVSVDDVQGGRKVVWQSTAQASSVHLRLTTVLSERTIEASEEKPGQWTAVLPSFSLREPLSRCIALLQLPGGVTRELDIAKLLSGEIKSIVDMAAKFDGRKVVMGLDRILTPDNKEVIKTLNSLKQDLKAESLSRQSKAPRVRAIIEERMEKVGAWKTYDKALLLSPMVLATKLLPFEERMKLHRVMQDIFQVYLYSRFVTAPMTKPPKVGDKGPWRLSYEPLAENMQEEVLFHSPDKPMKIGLRVPITRLFGVQHWEKNFSLPLSGECIAAELAININRLFDFICMHVKVNGLVDFVVYDCRQMPIAIPKEVSSKTRVIYQAIPVEALQQGQNVVVIEAEPVLRAFTRTSIPVEKITFRYLTK